MKEQGVANPPLTFEVDVPFEDLRRQKSVFSFITVFVLAVLFFFHTFFSSILGVPSITVMLLLGLALVLAGVELAWLQKWAPTLRERTVKIESRCSIVIAFLLTALLTYITDRDESPYFVLLAIPILQCAYVFGLFSTLIVIAAADGMIFLWIWHFFTLHPPGRATQYFEGGMLSVIFALMGVLVWLLVDRLKANQLSLSNTLVDLRATRERLITEEKLAAVGRLASGIAHEIRNPVAMISSSLATVSDPQTDRALREEMFAIATQESKRLEVITEDFLTYARPSRPRRSSVLMKDLLAYVSGTTKAHAAGRSISITFDLTADFSVDIDVPQVEGALLNLVLNAIDATPDGGAIKLSSVLDENILAIHVENSGPPIPESDLPRIFEPFFTTKPTGSGLGLAIARGAAKSHGGDLWLSSNLDGRVIFSLTLQKSTANDL